MPMRTDTRWSPTDDLKPIEQRMIARMKRTGRLYRFLRLHRRELFDEAFQEKLAEMYADVPKGRPPVPPALLMMVTLLQAYTGTSDAEAVHKALFDRRWQMVLDCLDVEDTPPFSQGVLAKFRFLLILHDLDRELVRRTVDLAKKTGDFGYKQLRVALDSAPIWGAGRVEDTFNLIGHALMVCVACAGDVLEMTSADVVATAGLKVAGRSSVKAALDIDWDDRDERKGALRRLLADVTAFRAWAAERVPSDTQPWEPGEPLADAVAQLERVVHQDTEPDPDGGTRITDGTSPDRQVSISDPEMRHGRKSKSKTVNGFKGHIAMELDHGLVLDALVLPANRREHAAADMMRPNIEAYAPISEFSVDRGYLSCDWITDLEAAKIPVFSKPWNPSNRGLFPKSKFTIDMKAMTVTCPAEEVVEIPKDTASDGTRQVVFEGCHQCPLKPQCSRAKKGGRSIQIHRGEAMLQRLQAAKKTPEGRKKLRERVAVEHALAHVLVYQPHKARYRGARRNTSAVLRAAAIVNLQATDRIERSGMTIVEAQQ